MWPFTCSVYTGFDKEIHLERFSLYQSSHQWYNFFPALLNVTRPFLCGVIISETLNRRCVGEGTLLRLKRQEGQQTMCHGWERIVSILFLVSSSWFRTVEQRWITMSNSKPISTTQPSYQSLSKSTMTNFLADWAWDLYSSRVLITQPHGSHLFPSHQAWYLLCTEQICLIWASSIPQAHLKQLHFSTTSFKILQASDWFSLLVAGHVSPLLGYLLPPLPLWT